MNLKKIKDSARESSARCREAVLQDCDTYADNMYSSVKDKKIFKRGCVCYLDNGDVNNFADYYNNSDFWVFKDGFQYAKTLCESNNSDKIKDSWSDGTIVYADYGLTFD